MKITKKRLLRLISEMMSIPNVKYIDDPDELNLQVAMKIKDMMSPDQALAMSEPQLRDMVIGIYEKYFDPEGEGWDPHDEDLEAIESHLTIIPLPDDPDFDPEEHGHHYEEHPTYDPAGKQDGVEYSFKKEGSMRLKESQLRKIIREELQLEFLGLFGKEKVPRDSSGNVMIAKLPKEEQDIFIKVKASVKKSGRTQDAFGIVKSLGHNPEDYTELIQAAMDAGKIAYSHSSMQNIMKITKRQLLQIIKEEKARLLKEIGDQPIPRAPGVGVYRISMVVAVAEDAVDAIQGSIEDGMEFNEDDGEGILEYDIKPETSEYFNKPPRRGNY